MILDCIQCRCRCPALLYHLRFFFLLPLTANHQKFNTALSKQCYVVWRLVLKRYLFSSAVISDGVFNVAVKIFFQHFIQCKDYSDSCFRSRRNLDSHHCGLYSVFTVVLATISQTTLFHLIHTFAPFYLTVFFSPAPELHPSFVLLLLQVFVHHPPDAGIGSLGVNIPPYKYKLGHRKVLHLEHVCNIAAVLIFLVYYF